MTRKLQAIAAILVMLFYSSIGWSQETVCNQGTPGNRGSWLVSLTSGSVSIGSVNTTPQLCGTPAEKITSVGVTAVSTPSSQLANRRVITLCNSPENPGSPKVKCRIDGVTPVMGNTNPGDVLTISSCITYPISASVTPSCISDTAATAVTSIECS